MNPYLEALKAIPKGQTRSFMELAALETPDDPYISKRKMLIGAKVKWDEGAGDSQIAVKLGIGNAEVHLD